MVYNMVWTFENRIITKTEEEGLEVFKVLLIGK